MKTVKIFDYAVSAQGTAGDVRDAYYHLKHGALPHYMACANPHSLVVAAHDPAFKKSLLDANWLVPDGVGVVWAARAFKNPVPEKVAGYNFFLALTELIQQRGGGRYFFLGSTGRVLGRIRARLKKEFPNVEVCGVYSPPYRESFSEGDDYEMLEAINAARPDVLWVGMTAPKQEKWIHKNLGSLKVPLVAAIGAVFDFYAGTKTRPSAFWVRLGLEWLPRFLKEPSRLWERNLKSTPLFIWWVFKERLRQVFSARGPS